MTECVYDSPSELEWGGLEDEDRWPAFCFGVVSVSPPLSLSTCTSVPAETSLEVVFDLTLPTKRDRSDELGDEEEEKRRRRRKRGAGYVLVK